MMGGRQHIRIRIARYTALDFGVAILLLLLTLVVAGVRPAHAGDANGTIELAFDLPAVASTHNGLVPPEGVPAVEPVSQNVLAMQRGSGAAFALPLLPAAQSQSGIVLWDEMKPPQNPSVSAPGGQSVNQINIQIR
ncbi:MAG TPA: hypothetical protein VJS41_03865 [Stellaceae bacterium]|nr:hypothetical protein [Stellaceae bacterium]